MEKSPILLNSQKIPPSLTDDALDAAIDEAQDQVEAIAGKWDLPVRFRLLDQRHDVPREKRRRAIQLSGSLGDDEFSRKLWKLNCEGYDVYVVAQEANSLLPEDAVVRLSELRDGHQDKGR